MWTRIKNAASKAVTVPAAWVKKALNISDKAAKDIVTTVYALIAAIIFAALI